MRCILIVTGEVLRDLLGAGVVPSVRLTDIVRQAQQSGVVTNAHRFNAGQMPLMQGLEGFYLVPEDDPERVAELVVNIVAHRLPRRFGLDAWRDVQVLCPMHRGTVVPPGPACSTRRCRRP